MRYAWVYSLCIGMCLSGIALWRGEFSVDLISIPIQKECSEMDPKEASQVLNQPYRFLSKGRQSFVFQSQDGLWVIKFFNSKYLKMPWYSFTLWNQEKERAKRERRQSFYLESYSLANRYLKEQTALVYLHDGVTQNLPVMQLQDQTSREFSIDLNKVPFVIQKKGELFCHSLKIMQEKDRAQYNSMLSQFLELIALRISKGIADADHDVEHNFGYLDGRVFHLDPGRLFLDDLSDPEREAHEWWSATHSLRKWLQVNAPKNLPDFDRQVADQKNFTVLESVL